MLKIPDFLQTFLNNNRLKIEVSQDNNEHPILTIKPLQSMSNRNYRKRIERLYQLLDKHGHSSIEFILSEKE